MKRLICFLVILLGISGCRTEQSEFNWRTFRWERTAPRQRYDANTESELGTIPQAAIKPDPRSSQREDKALEKTQMYRLYLSSKSRKVTVNSEDVVILHEGPILKLAEVLSLIYPGQGPGGVDPVYFYYRNETVCEMAKLMAEKFDLASGTVPEAWKSALVELTETEFPRKLSGNQRQKIVSKFREASRNSGNEKIVRWAGCVIAAELLSEYDPRDLSGAKELLKQAETYYGGSDFHAMVVRYYRIKILMDEGKKIPVKQEAQDALNYFQMWENTEVYEKIKALGKVG
jgi:hypothetical protein